MKYIGAMALVAALAASCSSGETAASSSSPSTSSFCDQYPESTSCGGSGYYASPNTQPGGTPLCVADPSNPACSDQGPIQVGSSPFHSIARKVLTGGYAVVIASGDAVAPARMRIRVLASPNQSVTVSWTVVCSQSAGASVASGQTTGNTPLTKGVKLPMKHPDSRSLSADSQLGGSGKITLILEASAS